jgi:lysophospholipase L1-like esterase
MNRLLSGLLRGVGGGRTMHWHPRATAAQALAMDGIHPGPWGYAAWADGLSEHILSAVK